MGCPRFRLTPQRSAGKESVATNLLAVGKAGTAEDLAAMAAELVTGSQAPDDLLEGLLGLLKASGRLSRKARWADYPHLDRSRARTGSASSGRSAAAS